MTSSASVLTFLRLPSLPIFQQLLLEEALYRTTPPQAAWVLLNWGAGWAAKPTVVLGISGKPQQLVHVDNATEDGIPLVRRYSGGGTVLVDENVLLCSMILPKSFTGVEPFPRPVMRWTGRLYEGVFGAPSGFGVAENDYVVRMADGSMRKVAGNAQSFTKDRFVHHTSFLWKVDDGRMGRYLTLPQRQPQYRANRTHSDFLTGISTAFPDTFSSPQALLHATQEVITEEALRKGFQVAEVALSASSKELSHFDGLIAQLCYDKPKLRSTFFVDGTGAPLPEEANGRYERLLYDAFRSAECRAFLDGQGRSDLGLVV
uniref:BPL/LPL catalytic domain-containing protein n=1 Tax=Vitrella brassicaformis TaxID=1169539 RepID=A0A7S1JNH4_9ALVE|mmetsp:Transcript_1711/g.3721  ORF Transcript_1711/g.3721 Transcript_1711/m.3721 type:complete len:317 (+) Transcript_1711:85-1035(+)